MEQARATALVEHLAHSNQPITAQHLADYLGLSVRSVKSYVKEINSQEKELIRSGNRGYTADPALAKKYLHKKRNSAAQMPQTYEERARYINRRFLTSHTDRLDCYELAEELCFSVETIRSDVPKMNLSFGGLGIRYELHGEQIFLIGDERALRGLSKRTLFADMENRMMDYTDIQKVFPKLDVETLRQILRQVMREHDLYVNDFGMVNMTLHIALILCRIQAQQCIAADAPILDRDTPEYRAMQALCTRLEQSFSIEFNDAERGNLYLLICSNENALLHDPQDLKRFVGEDLLDYVQALVQQINARYYVNLSNRVFFMPFAMHIRNLLFRAREHKSMANPLCDNIRYSYPLIFDMAVYTATLLGKQFHVEIAESEISYLALHIGGEMERQKQTSEKIRTVLLCPQYLELSSKLYNQLLIQFGDEIELVACVGLPEALPQYRFSLLITTVALPEQGEEWLAVQVPYLGLRSCRTQISAALEAIREKRKLQILRECFDQYFSPELFFVDHRDGLSGQEVLRQLADRMQSVGVVQEDYYERLIEREIAASTAFPNIAVPHSMKLDAIKTSICVLICPKGIVWGGHRVRVVLAVAIHKMDANVFSDLYQALIQLFDNEKNLRLILQKETYAEFREQIFKLL